MILYRSLMKLNALKIPDQTIKTIIRQKVLIKTYLLIVPTAVQVASKSLMEAITEVYEPTWSGSEALYGQASSIEVLWQDFSHKLGDQVLIPLNTYTAQFPEMRVSFKLAYQF